MTEEGVSQEEPRRLSDFLRARRDEILAAWETSVRKMRAARHLERPLLLDHMPQFLEDLAHYVDDLRAGLDALPPEENPRIHALERLEVGYDLSEVVAEYAALRTCILELVIDEGAPALRSVEMPRLHQALDEAIATSVVRYTEARERTLRALDRISTSALMSTDASSLLPAALDAFLANTASVDSVALALREGDELVVRGAAGYRDQLLETVPRDGFAWRVFEAGTPRFVRDASADPSLASSPLRLPGTHAMYAIPLTIGEQKVGVAVMGSRTSFEFSQEDQFLFRTLIHRVAGLIAQARLAGELARQAAALEAVIASLPEAVYVGDVTGIRSANEATLNLLGYASLDELRNDLRKVREDLDPRDLDGTPVALDDDPYYRALGGEASEREMIISNRHTHEDVVVHTKSAPVRVDGRIDGVVSVSHDITAQKREEEELRAALEFRDRLLGVLGHDLRNPLTVILTSAALLLRGGGLDEKQQRTVERVANNAQRIERMVHDLLDYTRVRQGRALRMQPRDCDLLGLCHQVVDGLQVVHPDRPIRLSAEGDTHGRWDPDRAMQVVSNLVSNALRYSPPGSAVTVHLKDEGSAVVLAVHNDGAPIPDEVRPKLFEAFQRGAADEAGPSANLGLGLWIVHQIVQAHGGSVEVRSDAGSGTMFRVRWPREQTH